MLVVENTSEYVCLMGNRAGMLMDLRGVRVHVVLYVDITGTVTIIRTKLVCHIRPASQT